MSRTSFACVGLHGLLIALLFCATPQKLFGQTENATGSRSLYLDSVHGADSNPGNQAAPWKTLKNLDGRTFHPGDSIYFARGSSFTGGFVISSSGSQTRPITFTTYGMGSPPNLPIRIIRY